MAILRCPQCNYSREVSNSYIGRVASCPQCSNRVKIYGTIAYTQYLLRKYSELRQQHLELQAEKAATLPHWEHSPSHLPESQEQPIFNWFAERHISMQADSKSLDSTSFFSCVALELGDNYAQLKTLLQHIQATQAQGQSLVTLPLEGYSNTDARANYDFCKTLYQHAFIAACAYRQSENAIQIRLKGHSSLIDFFNEQWLGWYIFSRVVMLCRSAQAPFSVLRELQLSLPNGKNATLNFFTLINEVFANQQSALACAYHQNSAEIPIEQYCELRQHIGLKPGELWVILPELEPEQAQSLNAVSRQELSFHSAQSCLVNLQTNLKTVG